MAFDFDDLDGGFSLPPELASISRMDDEAFGRFGERLRKAERLGKFEDFDQAITEALWEESDLAARTPAVLRELLALLKDVAGSKKDAKYVERSGFALMYTVHRFSVSCSQHEVRVRRAAPGAPCVLLLGFGGSHVDDLEGQAEYYHLVGFTVISMSSCQGPPLLQAKQSAKLGYELRTLLSDGARLHVHACSNYGFMRWIDVMNDWNQGVVPLDSLPPLQACLASLVVECAPQIMIDPYTGEVIPLPGSAALAPPPDAAEPEAAAGPGEAGQLLPKPPTEPAPIEEPSETWKKAEEAEVGNYLMVIMGCIGANYKRWAPEAGWSKMLYAEKKFMPWLRGAARHGAFWLGEEAARREKAKQKLQFNGVTLSDDRKKHLPGSGEGLDLGYDQFVIWEHMDVAIQPPIPRLFLYTAEDKIILPIFSEAYARHTRRYHPQAKVLVKRCEISEHCRLWTTEYEGCAEAVSELLSIAGFGLA